MKWNFKWFLLLEEKQEDPGALYWWISKIRKKNFCREKRERKGFEKHNSRGRALLVTWKSWFPKMCFQGWYDWRALQNICQIRVGGSHFLFEKKTTITKICDVCGVHPKCIDEKHICHNKITNECRFTFFLSLWFWAAETIHLLYATAKNLKKRRQ